MPLDSKLTRDAVEASNRAARLQREAEQAHVAYQHAVRRLHAAGGSLREIAAALGLSHQRVHQIVDVSSGKGAVKVSRIDGLRCAFCGRERDEVQKLVAGPGLHICDRCVDLADEVVAVAEERSSDRTLLRPVELASPRARCGFCGKRRDRVDAMAHAPLQPGAGKYAKRDPGARICVDCLRLCDEILAEAGVRQ